MTPQTKLVMDKETHQLKEVTPEVTAINMMTFVIRDELRALNSTLTQITTSLEDLDVNTSHLRTLSSSKIPNSINDSLHEIVFLLRNIGYDNNSGTKP